MHAGDDHIHLGEHVVGKIEVAVGEDVDFNSGEDGDASIFLLASRMRLNVATARASSRPLAKARFLEWSVMAMYL
jgi:hypothetical protein